MPEPAWDPDADLANADWPKRTPDKLSDIEAAIKREKAKRERESKKK